MESHHWLLAIKYLSQAGNKGTPAQELEDLKKAKWYLECEITRLEAEELVESQNIELEAA